MAQQKIQSSQLTDTGVTPGPYTTANITVDSAGRITAASNGTSGSTYTAGNLIDPVLFPLNEIAVRDIIIDPTGGNNNVFVGVGTGLGFTTGKDNVMVGSLAGDELVEGSRNVLIGTEAGCQAIRGDGNIFVGYKAGKQQAIDASGNLSNRFIINDENVRNPASFPPFIIGRLTPGNEFLRISSNLTIVDGNNIDQFTFSSLGEIFISGSEGNPGEVLTSDGPGSTVYWAPSSGGGGGPEPLNQIVFGTGISTTSSPDFTFDPTISVMEIDGTGSAFIEVASGEDLTVLANSLILEGSGQAIIEAAPGEDVTVIAESLIVESPGGSAVVADNGELTLAGDAIVFRNGIGGESSEKFRIANTGAFIFDGYLGNPGEVLTSNGDISPSWQAAGGGGGSTSKYVTLLSPIDYASFNGTPVSRWYNNDLFNSGDCQWDYNNGIFILLAGYWQITLSAKIALPNPSSWPQGLSTFGTASASGAFPFNQSRNSAYNSNYPNSFQAVDDFTNADNQGITVWTDVYTVFADYSTYIPVRMYAASYNSSFQTAQFSMVVIAEYIGPGGTI
jgi:hypothetical protein